MEDVFVQLNEKSLGHHAFVRVGANTRSAPGRIR